MRLLLCLWRPSHYLYISHTMHQRNRSRCGAVCRGILKLANRVWGNEVVMDYLREGRFEYSTPIPGQSNVLYEVHTPCQPEPAACLKQYLRLVVILLLHWLAFAQLPASMRHSGGHARVQSG